MTRQGTIEKKAKVIKITLRVIFILTIIVIGYAASLVYSIIFFVKEIDYGNIDATSVYDDNRTPYIISDDTVDFSIAIPIGNGGIYPIEYLHISLNLIVPTCTNLTDNTIAGTADETTPQLQPGATINWTIPVIITTNTTILLAIAVYSPDFMLQFSFEAKIHFLTIFFSGEIPISI